MKKEVTMLNKSGLHARPAGLFVSKANKYKCDIKLEKDGRAVNAKSLMAIISLEVCSGDKINIITEGADEREAMDELAKLIDNKFGE